MGAAVMVSYARAKSEGLGFTAGTGMAAVGVMPREVRLVILSLGLIVAGSSASGTVRQPVLHRQCAPAAHPSSLIALAIIAVGSTITTIQRILHVRSQAETTTRPPRATNGATETHVSKNGTNGNSKNGATPANTWAGAGRRGDGKIRVAIVGVGNCASSLVQGRYYYENANDDDFVPGLMHVNLGGYHVRDIEFVAAFDIDKNKVGKDLAEAIYTKPNNTYVFQQGRAHRRHRRARHGPRRARQVPEPDHREGARARRPTSSASSRSARST